MIPVEYELVLSRALFCVGLYGAMVRKNAIIVLMSIEIILTAAIFLWAASAAHDPKAALAARRRRGRSG